MNAAHMTPQKRLPIIALNALRALSNDHQKREMTDPDTQNMLHA